MTDAERDAQAQYHRDYRAKNIDSLKKYRKNHYLQNRAEYLAAAKAWASENPSRRKKICDRYLSNNPESRSKSVASYRQRNLENPLYRARIIASSMVHRVLRLHGRDKNARSFDYLGYTRDALISHIERQFLPGMDWGNYGEWHIDHVIPVSELVEIGVTDPKEINSLNNLRPLWASDNIKKHAKFELCHSNIEFIKAGRASSGNKTN